MSNPLLEAALSYAARGWFVVPNYTINDAATGNPCTCGKGRACGNAGKHPRLNEWETEATTDPEKIKGWWEDKPFSNVGIATGPSRLIVVDVDGEEGALSLMSLIEGKDWPDTVRFASGSGRGTHYLFTLPAGVDLRNKQEWKEAPGVDIRAGGGQIVAPPSLHKSGGNYRVLSGPVSPAPVPTWLAVKLAAELAKRETRPGDEMPPPAEGPAEPSPRARAALRKYEQWRHAFDVEKASRTNALGGAGLDLFGFVKSRELRYEAAIDSLRALGEAWGWFARYGEEEFQRQVMINAWGNARAKDPSDHPAHLAWEQGPLPDPPEESGAPGEEKAPRKGAATVIVDLVSEAGIELWHNVKRKCFATIPIGDHREHYPLKSEVMIDYLGLLHYRATGRNAAGAALQDALGTLRAKALWEGPEREAYVRCAEVGGKFYLDLADPKWRAIEIDAEGWRIVESSPVPFLRRPGLYPLPEPERGGSFDELRGILNAPGKEEWYMLLAWMIAGLRPPGPLPMPYPILLVQGEQGSAKSTTAKIARALLDPNECPLRAAPTSERDLAIAAGNGWVLAFDNLSGLPLWLSDALCRVATGAGFAVRAHYKDDEEALFNFRCPVLLNGIDDVANRGDLADRALSVFLPRIDEEGRKTEAEVWAAFYAARGRILGALLDVVVVGIKNLPSTKLARRPRMADFAEWITACEPALPWAKGEFLAVYDKAREAASEISIEDDPLAQATLRFLKGKQTEKTLPWEGTHTDLLKELERQVDEATRRGKGWPARANTLSNKLTRLSPQLRVAGVTIERPPKNEKRTILLNLISQTPPEGSSDRRSTCHSEDLIPNSGSSVASSVPSGGSSVDPGYPPDWDDL